MNKIICAYEGCNIEIDSSMGNKYCLGHSELENKNCSPEIFHHFIADYKLKKGDFDFDGFIFPYSFNYFENYNQISHKIVFRNCKFYGDNYSHILTNEKVCLDLIKGNFNQPVELENCRFYSNVLINANLMEKLSLSNSTIEGSLYILNTSVRDVIEFSNLNINQSLTLQNNNLYKFYLDIVKIISDSTFKNNKFNDCCSFEDCKFQGKLELNNTVFNDEILIDECNFENLVNISSNEYKSKFSFLNNIVDKIDFSNSKFNNKTIFQKNKFNTNVNLTDALFKQESNWIENDLINSNYEHAEFQGSAYFNKCNIIQNSNFGKTIFTKVADFSNTNFSISQKSEVFFETEFHARTIFKNNKIEGEIKFDRPLFYSNSVFILDNIQYENTGRIIFLNCKFPSFASHFQNARLLYPLKDFRLSIIFRNCNLEDVYFSNNDMSIFSFYKSSFDKARFVSNTWLSVKENLCKLFRYTRKNVIFEDYLFSETETISNESRGKTLKNFHVNDINSYEEIANLYRRFKTSLDVSKDYEQAGWFYFNEFEMKRKACKETIEIQKRGKNKKKKKSKSKYFIYSLYKVFTGYGEKPIWSFYWFIVFALIFSVINMYVGLKFNGNEILKYYPAFNANGIAEFLSFSWLSDFLISLVFTISRIIPLGYLPIPKEHFFATTPIGYIVSVTNTIVLLFFLTFIAVGLKRIFRRF